MSLFTKKYQKKDFSVLDHIPQMGDAILIHTEKPNIISEGIEWFENGKVSHVDMYVGGGGGSVIGYTKHGCTQRSLSCYYKPYYTIVVRRIKGLTVTQASMMKDAAYKDLVEDRPYDFLSFTGFIWMCTLNKLGIKNPFKKDNPVQGRGKVCSTAYDSWALRAGLDLFTDIGEEATTPQHILESDKFDTIISV